MFIPTKAPRGREDTFNRKATRFDLFTINLCGSYVQRRLATTAALPLSKNKLAFNNAVSGLSCFQINVVEVLCRFTWLDT